MSPEETRENRQPSHRIGNSRGAKYRTKDANHPAPERKAPDPRHARVAPYHLPKQYRSGDARIHLQPSPISDDVRYGYEPSVQSSGVSRQRQRLQE